jgi:hypothetical protein
MNDPLLIRWSRVREKLGISKHEMVKLRECKVLISIYLPCKTCKRKCPGKGRCKRKGRAYYASRDVEALVSEYRRENDSD